MAKKLSDWERRLNELKESAQGEMPKMATVDLDVWIPMSVKAQTIAEGHDAGPPMTDKHGNKHDNSGWSCYRCEASIDDEEWEHIEVPFWAMTDFLNAVIETADNKGLAHFEFKRSLGNKGLNEAEFQWE